MRAHVVVSARVGWVAVTVWAFLLRSSHSDFGLPANFHPDEGPATRQVVQALRAGSLSLHSYFHPPLLRELAWLANVARPMEGVGEEELARRVTSTMRWISVIAGTVSVPLVGWMASYFVPPFWSLVTAGLWASHPLPVFQAKYGTPDALLCAWMVLGVCLALRLTRHPRPLAIFGGGLVLALAVATKYNGIFLLGSFVGAFLVAERWGWRRFGDWLLPFAAGAGLGALLGFPLLWSEWDDFWRTASTEAEHQFVRGHRGIKVGPTEYWYAFPFVRSVWPSTGPFLFGCLAIGLGFLIADRRPRKWVLLGMLVPYYLAMEQTFKLTFSPQRYVLPLLPIYFLAAAVTARWLAERIRRVTGGGRWVALALAAALLSPSVYECVRLLVSLEPDTRTRAAAWVLDHVPRHASVAIGGLRAFYPPLSRAQLPRLTQLGREAEYAIVSSFDYEEAFEYPQQTPGAYEFYKGLFETQDVVFEASPVYRSFLFHNPTIKVLRRRSGQVQP